jgi:glycosyltransferase involved in cell wall biosynthesis
MGGLPTELRGQSGGACMHGTRESAEGGLRRRREHDREPVVWFEVEDFLRYFDHFRNPTGLQRVPFEIFVEAERLYSKTGRVRFCRLSVYTRQFRAISFDAVVQAYLNPPGANAPWKTVWGPSRFLSEFSNTMRLIARHPGFFLSILRTAVRDLVDMIFRPRGFARLVRPGDTVVALGASWGFPGYGKHLAAAKRRYGVRFAVLIYDTIPLENETLVEARHVDQVRSWLQEVLPTADVVLTISKYSQHALRKLVADARLSLPRIEVLALGAGLSDRPIAAIPRAISLPQRYVLFVSTIEIRKNHRLLVRIWRRLLERHGPDAVPVLIFAGQIGWLVDDLLADLADSRHLGGKIEIRPDLTDAELRTAYDSCLFTVFPSLYEGWGLPIAESLARGKFCVASNRTAIPEVGGDLIDYFDPSDDDDALAKVERVLIDPGYLTAREARLRAEYRPPTWADCVHGLIGTLGRPAPAKTE